MFNRIFKKVFTAINCIRGFILLVMGLLSFVTYKTLQEEPTVLNIIGLIIVWGLILGVGYQFIPKKK